MPTEATYSLTDLSRLADVTPRTVRYYIGQGLLPSPGAGPGGRYGDAHLARLRVIRRLQREHLPLAEIRRRLEEMPDDEVIAMADTSSDGAGAPPEDSAAEYIRDLVAGPARDLSPPPPPPAAAMAFSLAEMPAPGPPAPPEPDRSTWERHNLAPDVELHVRRPLDRPTSKQVERLIRIARELLADET